MNNYEINTLPIAKTDEHQQRPISALVEKILAAKRDNPEADTTKLEEKIDALVYKLYGVTEEERKIIETPAHKTMLAPSSSLRRPMEKAGEIKRQETKAA